MTPRRRSVDTGGRGRAALPYIEPYIGSPYIEALYIYVPALSPDGPSPLPQWDGSEILVPETCFFSMINRELFCLFCIKQFFILWILILL